MLETYYQNADPQVFSTVLEQSEEWFSDSESADFYSPLARGDRELVNRFTIFGERFFNCLLIFDLCDTYLRQVHFLHFVAVTAGSKSSKNSAPDYSRSAIFTLLSKLVHDIIAIRLLVLNGLDVQARQIARSLSEVTDALVVIPGDAALSKAYVSAQTDADANRFWFNHISKGRVRRRLRNFLKEDLRLDEEAIGEMLLYRYEEDRAFGQAVHVSHTSGFMTVMGNLSALEDGMMNEKEFDSLTVYGQPSYGSIRTLKYAIFNTMNTILFLRKLDIFQYEDVLVKFNEDDANIVLMSRLRERRLTFLMFWFQLI